MSKNEEKRYSGVQLQQGRVQLDGDWNESRSGSARFYGIYRGQVVDNTDPLLRMRLRIRLPDILGDQEVWAEPCIPVGVSVAPTIGNVVWIMFEGGDASHPVWIGTFWQKNEVPDQQPARANG